MTHVLLHQAGDMKQKLWNFYQDSVPHVSIPEIWNKSSGSCGIIYIPKRPCPSGFYRNAKGQCVQKGVGPAYKGG